MKVWIHLNGSQEGPYELENLPLDRMDATTPVWYEGLADWMAAGQAPLTAGLFGFTYGQSLRVSQDQQASGAAARPEADKGAKCPATYLGWSIAMTVLCCNPVGIVAIMTGATTRSKFNSRDYAGARKMSETTAWWFMITIVTSLMFLPFALILS